MPSLDWAQGVALVGTFDPGFGALGEDRGASAVGGGLAASSEAGEVFVAVPGLVTGASDHELGSAGTVQGAFKCSDRTSGVVRRGRCWR